MSGMLLGMETTPLITRIMPRLVVDDAAAAVDFDAAALGSVAGLTLD